LTQWKANITLVLQGAAVIGREFLRNSDHQFFIRLGISLLVYLLVLAAAVRFATLYPLSPWRTLVVVTPVLPAIYTVVIFARHIGQLDELQRRIQLEALSFGFAATAVLTFAYGFLEQIGYPRLSWHFVLPLMTILWSLGSWLANRHYR
jgi:hypothetical protein